MRVLLPRFKALKTVFKVLIPMSAREPRQHADYNKIHFVSSMVDSRTLIIHVCSRAAPESELVTKIFPIEQIRCFGINKNNVWNNYYSMGLFFKWKTGG